MLADLMDVTGSEKERADQLLEIAKCRDGEFFSNAIKNGGLLSANLATLLVCNLFLSLKEEAKLFGNLLLPHIDPREIEMFNTRIQMMVNFTETTRTSQQQPVESHFRAARGSSFVFMPGIKKTPREFIQDCADVLNDLLNKIKTHVIHALPQIIALEDLVKRIETISLKPTMRDAYKIKIEAEAAIGRITDVDLIPLNYSVVFRDNAMTKLENIFIHPKPRVASEKTLNHSFKRGSGQHIIIIGDKADPKLDSTTSIKPNWG